MSDSSYSSFGIGPFSVCVFLMALKLFTACRGVPIKILSDNGTNFSGSRVLPKEIERISTSAVENKYSEICAFITQK